MLVSTPGVNSSLDLCCVGGTFALYSLLKRAGDFRTFGKAHPADTKLERYSVVQGGHQGNALNRQHQPEHVDWRLKLARNVTYQKVTQHLAFQ